MALSGIVSLAICKTVSLVIPKLHAPA